MPFISERLARMNPSPTISMTAKASELRAEGKDVIGLSAGEPDFDTPDNIKMAAKAAMDAGLTKYTAVDGTPALKAAIIRKFRRENDLNYDMGQINVGTGGKQVLYNALMATVDSCDEVIIPTPYWVSYPDMVRWAGGRPVLVSCSAERKFKLQPDELDAAITERTKWVILNNPNNPTGAVYHYTELKALTDILIKYPHVHILSDDIYEHLIYDGCKFVTPAQVEPRLFDRTLTVNGLSKAYAMTGWRIGYGAGPPELIKAMARIQSQTTTNPCSIAQAAAVEALNGPQNFLPLRNDVFRRRRDLVLDRLNKIDGLDCNLPNGAFYLFPDCNGIIGRKTSDGKVLKDDVAVVSYLLETAWVAVVPGSAFGRAGFFRIAYTANDSTLTTALDRIEKALNDLH